MPIEMTVRHVSVNPRLQEHAQAKAEALVDEFPKIEFVHVILDKQHKAYEVEYIVQHKQVPQMSGKAADENLISAADGAYSKVWRQLRKHYDKVADSHHERSTIREPNPG